MVEEVKQEGAGGKGKLSKIRQIETQMISAALDSKEYETDAPEDYTSMSPEDAFNSKYMATFPYPYMNGYLHLGK